MRIAAMGAAMVGLLAAVAIHYRGPDPSADVARGSDDAFARGLFPRELLERQGPMRWTRERAFVRFHMLPSGPGTLEVVARGHRSPVTVLVDGTPLGVIDPGARLAVFSMPAGGGRSRQVELHTPTFQPGGKRALGTQLRRVTWRSASRGAPPGALVMLFVLVALGGFGAAATVGMRPPLALLGAAGATTALGLSVWPSGMVRSPYAAVAAAVVLGGCFGAALVTRRFAWAWPALGPGAYAGLLVAFVVQGLLATSPLMVVSDAVFHANNLQRFVEGDVWMTSQTQHVPPFRFPYGVSFYAVLAPFYLLGLDPVGLVRAGAAVSGLAASIALLWLLAPRGDGRAGLAVGAWQLLPVTFDLYSFGNLSNVFGQALTALFFCWWAAGGRHGWGLGAILLAVGALGHFSSLVVLTALSCALLAYRWRDLRIEWWRPAAVGVGLGLAFAYYARFVPLVLAQLPRLLEGTGASAGPAATSPLIDVVRQWGAPAIALGAAGVWRTRRNALDRDLAAYWTAGAALFLVGLASPLDVRHLHALGLPLAVAVAEGAYRLWSLGVAGRIGAVALALAQMVAAARNMGEALLWRYRP
jgi:MYXO-CTERM domain-containing protein